jgi:hypothetical protein
MPKYRLEIDNGGTIAKHGRDGRGTRLLAKHSRDGSGTHCAGTNPELLAAHQCCSQSEQPVVT